MKGISEDPLNYRGGEVRGNGLEWGEEIHSAYACKAEFAFLFLFY